MSSSPELIFCKACVLDGSAPEIILDENGVCNFCTEAQRELALAEKNRNQLDNIIWKIKKDGAGNKYDVLIGLSGGVDSATVLSYAVKLGLRPLTFNVDNGWNRGAESDENVLKMVEKLQVPFYRYVINQERFKELQGALMRAGVKNLEAATDHVLFAATYDMANKYGIKWILSGGNVATESIMPASWGEDPRDLYWLKNIYKKITGKKLTGLPLLPLWKEQYYRLIKQKKFLRLLDFYEYNRERAIKKLQEEFDYIPYGEKHCESVFTWWFQNFYLYEKWGIDKRKAHLSSLINSGQMTRSEAEEVTSLRPEYPRLGLETRVMKYPKRVWPDSKRWRMIVARIYRYIPKRWK